MAKFISIRVVKAEDLKTAIEFVEDNDFDETDPLCDAVIPLDNALRTYINLSNNKE